MVTIAKRPLKAGEPLDGAGGSTVHGKPVLAETSLARGCLPLGLAHNVKPPRDIGQGGVVGWADVPLDEADTAVAVRREMEADPGAAAAVAAR